MSSLLSVAAEAPVQIEKAEPKDFPRIASIASLAWSVPDINFILNRLKQPNSVAFVAKIDNKIVGVTTATIGRKKIKTICEETAVLPLWQGQGIANKLLDSLMPYLKAKGVRKVWGYSLAQKTKPLLFFIHYGFKPKKISREKINGGSIEIVYTTCYCIH